MANNTDWLNLSPMSGGTGQTNLSLTALTNTGLTQKFAVVTAYNERYNVQDATIVRIEGFQPTLTLSRSTLRFDSTGGTATFTVYSNTAWTIQFPSIVSSYSTSAGTGDTEVTIALGENIEQVAKIETGYVEDVYGVNRLPLTVVQEALVVFLEVEPDDDIVFEATGSSTAITITSNADWEILANSWITPSVLTGGSGTTIVLLTADPNTEEYREGTVSVISGSKYVIMKATQDVHIDPYLTVSPRQLVFSYSGESRNLLVSSYPEWTAEIVSTGSSHWGQDIALKVTLEVETDNVTVSNLGQGGCIINGVVNPGTSYTFKSSGTYTILYPFTGESLNGMGNISGNSSVTVTSIEIGDNITTIPSKCFSGQKITSITIPSGITYIGDSALSCPNLTTIYAEPTLAPTITNKTFEGIAQNGTLHYPQGSNYSTWLSGDEYYLGYNFWNGRLPSGMEWLYTVSYDVTSTTQNTKILGNSYYVRAIKDRTTGVITYLEPGHSSSSYLTYRFSQTGKQDLEFLVSGNFYLGDSMATDLVLNGGGTKLATVQAEGERLTGVTINGGRINCMYGSGTGNNYSMFPSVTNLTFGPDAVVLNRQESFSGCTWLKVVDMSQCKSLELPENCFDACSGLTTVSLPSGLTKLVTYVFRKCVALTSITIPEGVTQVRNGCFENCSALTSVTLPSTLETMAESTFTNNWDIFRGCSSLQKIWSYAIIPPLTSGGTSNTASTFGGCATGGTFYKPEGSSYSADEYNYLRNRGWNFEDISAADYGLRTSMETIKVTQIGGTRNLSVSSLLPWTGSTDKYWFSLSPTGGTSGKTAVVITYEDGEYDIERTGTITLANGVATKEITIAQEHCQPIRLTDYLGAKNNAGEFKANCYVFNSGVTYVNDCEYDFTGIKSIHTGLPGSSSGTPIPAAIFGSSTEREIQSGVTGVTGCLRTLECVEISIPDVTHINDAFGMSFGTVCQTITSATFNLTDNVIEMRRTFLALPNLKKVKLGNLSRLTTISSVFASDWRTRNETLTDLEIDALPDQNLTGFAFRWLPNLSVNSLLNILQALPVTTASGRTVGLSEDQISKLTEAQREIATNKGWSLN